MSAPDEGDSRESGSRGVDEPSLQVTLYKCMVLKKCLTLSVCWLFLCGDDYSWRKLRRSLTCRACGVAGSGPATAAITS